MKAVIIVKGNEDHRVVRNIKAHIEMRLNRRLIDKIEYQSVCDSIGTEVLCVRTTKKTFEDLKEQLDVFYPKQCVFITTKMGLI